jgi:uncharacterized protein (DUF934 family)
VSTLIQNEFIVEDDYLAIDDEATPPDTGKIIVSLARWQKDGETLRKLALEVGVRIPNTAEMPAIWPQLKDCNLVALEFPAFGDGRAYSQALLLRQRYRFTGDIRATGAAVVRDQIHNMMRTGINSFLLRSDQDAKACLDAYHDFTLAYQNGADSATQTVLQKRRRQFS